MCQSFSISDLNWDLPNQEVLSDFLIRHQFRSLFNRVNVLYDAGNLSSEQHSLGNFDNVVLIADVSHLNNVITQVQNTGYLSIFGEESRSFLRIYLSYDSEKCYVVNLDQHSEDLETHYSYIEPILGCLFDESVCKITYDIKFVCKSFCV